MEFNPNNKIIQLCVRGIGMEATGKPKEAKELFIQAWNESTNDFERFIAADFVAKVQTDIPDKLKWYETSLLFAQKINDIAAQSALPGLHSKIAKCYEDLNDKVNAKKNSDLASLHADKPSDKGPFYHGTKADLKAGDFLTAGSISNYDSKIKMNHIYFTALANGAGLAAALAKGEGQERVYIVEPTGSFENDPNVTDKKFPGNPTRSYRSKFPLRILGELSSWIKQSQEDIQRWREKLANNKGEIIN
jgi:rifampin ADP-ribosylating transferase